MEKALVSKTRRTWPLADKIRIVEASFVPGASVSVIARANDVNANQVFLWRRQFRKGLLPPATAESSLLPVRIARDTNTVPTRRQPDVPASGSILIELASARLRIEGSIDRATLLTVLEVFHS
ncbi:MAG TPA: transposase [Pseudolysinimonas sp.]|jgi:transposase